MKTYTARLLDDGSVRVAAFDSLPEAKADVGALNEAGVRFFYVLQGANDLATASSAELVALHNGLLPEGGNKASNFDDLKKGAKKVFAMVLKGCITSPVPGDQAPAAGTEAQNPPASVKPKRQKTMATKTKKAVKKAAKKAAKKTATPRVKAPAFIEIGGGAPPAGTTCGLYIRSLIMKGATTEDILAKVKKHYPDSTAKGSDVSWNRQKLRADGVKNVPDARVAKEE